MEDTTNQLKFLMIGKHAEKLLSISCHNPVIKGDHDDSFVLSSHLQKLVGNTKMFNVCLRNQNNDFGKMGFVVHGLLEDEPPTNLKIGSIKPCMPTSNIGKQVLTTSTLVPFTPSQSHNQET